MKLPNLPFPSRGLQFSPQIMARLRPTRPLGRGAGDNPVSSARMLRDARRWAIWGALAGTLVTIVLYFPAAWVASAIAGASGGRLLLVHAEGSLWRGSGLVVLTGGAGSRDTLMIPSRIDWTLRPTLSGLRLTLAQACCLEPGLAIEFRPRLSGLQIALLPADERIGHWPAAWLTGLGTPWNTLQPGGILQLSTRAMTIQQAGGRWHFSGEMQLDLQQASSRLSTLAPLGSYRVMLSAPPAAADNAAPPSKLTLITLEGALQINGTGELGTNGVRFRGEARASPGSEAALDNLLNIIGRRAGAPSIIAIG